MLRWRILFSRGEEVKFLSHLDLMRLWERALRRAQVPLAYSQGFTPHPKLSLASPLPLGVTSEGELMDIFLDKPFALNVHIGALKRELPQGIDIGGVWTVPLNIPSLQSQVRFAEYRVEGEGEIKEIEQRIEDFLHLKELPWQHNRHGQMRHYDLRALVEKIHLLPQGDKHFILEMRLRCDNKGSGRPEQVAKALGFIPLSVHRTKLLLS